MTSPAGDSGTPLPAKLGIRPGMRVALVDAPPGAEAILGVLPEGAVLQHGLVRGERVGMVIDFVIERGRLARDIGWVVTTLPPDGPLWVAWPKKASRVATDMTEDAVREIALPMGWVDVKVCAIDATWSGLKLVLRKKLRPARS
jgi:hypothetical protein